MSHVPVIKPDLILLSYYQLSIISDLGAFFTDKFSLSQSDAMISVAYNSCQWKTLTKRLIMKCPSDKDANTGTTCTCTCSPSICVYLLGWNNSLFLPFYPSNYRSYRYAAYRMFTYWTHGILGKGVRRVIPACVLKTIRQTFPADDGRYVGFKQGADGEQVPVIEELAIWTGIIFYMFELSHYIPYQVSHVFLIIFLITVLFIIWVTTFICFSNLAYSIF